MKFTEPLDQLGIVAPSHVNCFQAAARKGPRWKNSRIPQKEIGVAQNDGKTVVQVVGYSHGHCAQRSHSLLLNDLLLCLVQIRYGLLQIRRV